MNKKEIELAVCQMRTIYALFSGGGMSIEAAIQELNLDNTPCLLLAEKEGLGWIANRIRQLINPKFYGGKNEENT